MSVTNTEIQTKLKIFFAKTCFQFSMFRDISSKTSLGIHPEGWNTENTEHHANTTLTNTDREYREYRLGFNYKNWNTYWNTENTDRNTDRNTENTGNTGRNTAPRVVRIQVGIQEYR